MHRILRGSHAFKVFCGALRRFQCQLRRMEYRNFQEGCYQLVDRTERFFQKQLVLD